MGRHEWGDVHFWCGVVCVIATVVHMLLNWVWLKRIAASGHFWRLLAGVGVGLVIIFGIFFLPMSRPSGGGIMAMVALKWNPLDGNSFGFL